MAEDKKTEKAEPTIKVEAPKAPDPATIPRSSEAGKNHVDHYLLGKGIRPWEYGGKRAYAKHHGKEFGTDAEFDELFKKY